MFENTLDKKKEIIDNKGNTIIDLTPSIFSKNAAGFSGYTTVKLSNTYEMRPDKVSFAEYGNIDSTEFILKYSGISNPFSLADDDVLMIPNLESAKAQMLDKEEVLKEAKIELIKNYYKFTNKDFKSDSTAYDDLANKKIESGVLDPTEGEDYIVPYISDNGTAAITIKNGKMYFGEDNFGSNLLPTANANVYIDENGKVVSDKILYVDEDGNIIYDNSALNANSNTNTNNKITSLLQSTFSNLQDKCAINGMSVADFVRASTKNS